MPSIAYYNGEFQPYDDHLTVSAHDRGFNFGDGIYEVIRVYHGKLHGFEPHMNRMERSACAIDMTLLKSRAQYRELLDALMARSGLREAMIYGQVTRGASLRDHYYNDDAKAQDFWFIRELDTRIIRQRIVHGWKLITLPDERWSMCHIKSVSLLANVMAKNKARKAGAQEAMFIEPSTGLVTEGGASNLFCVKDGIVYTAPEGPKILPGIIREYLLKLAPGVGIEIREEAKPLDFYLAADEVVASSSTMEIMPIRAIDGKPTKRANEKGHGPVFAKLFRAFLDDVAHHCGPQFTTPEEADALLAGTTA